MKLMQMIAPKHRASIAEKIIDMHEQARRDLRSYLTTYLRSQDLSESDKAMLDDENLMDIKIAQAQDADSFALKANIKLSKQNPYCRKKQSKGGEITDFIDDAIKSALSNMKKLGALIQRENYIDALETSMLLYKAMGCLETAEKLSLFDRLIKKETADKRKAANAKNPYLPQVKEIVLSVAAKHANLLSTSSKLFEKIEDDCESEIEMKLGSKAIKWNAGNFVDVFKRHTKNDKEFGGNINLLLKKSVNINFQEKS